MADSRSGSRSGSGSGSGSSSTNRRSPLLSALVRSVKTSRRATKKTKKRLRKRRATLRHRDRLLQERLKGYVMLEIRDADPELLKEIDTHMAQCWAETTFASDALRDLRYSKERMQDIVFKRNAAGEIIFSRIITRIPEAKGVYVNYTCVSPDERSKGHYKNSLHVMRKYYEGTPYVYIFNQADTKNAGGMDHSTRLKIFHKLGYRLNPDYAIVEGEDEKGEGKCGSLMLRLKSGEIAEYVDTPSSSASTRSTHSYSVKTATGVRLIGVDDIDRCIARRHVPVEIQLLDDTVRAVLGRGPGGRGYVTKNPRTGADEIIYSEDVLDVIYTPVEGDTYDAELYEERYCPLRMAL